MERLVLSSDSLGEREEELRSRGPVGLKSLGGGEEVEGDAELEADLFRVRPQAGDNPREEMDLSWDLWARRGKWRRI